MISDLLETLETLMGPDGCPWDQKQTFESLRSSVIEEAQEVVEAVNKKDDTNLQEELGDLLFNVLFFCKIAEKESRFTTQDVIKTLHDKLIRRHPHVFGDTKIETMEELKEQWERIKLEEKMPSTSAGKDEIKNAGD